MFTQLASKTEELLYNLIEYKGDLTSYCNELLKKIESHRDREHLLNRLRELAREHYINMFGWRNEEITRVEILPKGYDYKELKKKYEKEQSRMNNNTYNNNFGIQIGGDNSGNLQNNTNITFEQEKVFNDLLNEIKNSNISEDEKKIAIDLTVELKEHVGKPTFIGKFKDFIQQTSNIANIITTFKDKILDLFQIC
ncbi:MAG: hypothetical protein LBL93_02720 [Ruminococcus sp.]|jgi:hypothetical protein|nr:hypothetical protein [Ruminococcus sp.]